MVAEFSTMGSCSSRAIFNSRLNEGYKNFFHINDCLEAVSLISLMSKQFRCDETLIDSNSYDNHNILQDFSKEFLNFLKKGSIEYLIIDTYFDAISNIIIVDDETFITETGGLMRTSIHKTLGNKKKINIWDNFDEYLLLWKHSCDLFFDFLKNNCENIKIILNCSRSVYKYRDDDGKIIEKSVFKNQYKLNKYRNILDQYILENYDVEVLPFDENTLCCSNHVFDLHPVHYEERYYSEKTNQLKTILDYNEIFDWNDNRYVDFRFIKRNYTIMNFNLMFRQSI